MLGIVILNYKNFADTLTCVDSIRANNIDGDYRIYIVDNASPNESQGVLTEKYAEDDGITLIYSDTNGGFSAGNNIGLRQAVKDGCEAVLCTNSDVVFKDDCINQLKRTLFADQSCAVVGPKVYDGNGQIQNRNKGKLTASIFILKRKGFGWLDVKKKQRKYAYVDYDYSYNLKPEGMVSGCCFMIKANVLEKIDYLDENVFLYHEEDILGAKLRSINMYPLLDVTAEIIHLEGQSTGGLNAFLRYNTLYSGLYYLKKYTDTKKIAFNFACFVAKIMFFIKSLTNKEYKENYKKLKNKIKMLKKA